MSYKVGDTVMISRTFTPATVSEIISDLWMWVELPNPSMLMQPRKLVSPVEVEHWDWKGGAR